jgi:predicted alpha/beta-hydrolase family hydrolase
MKLRYNGPKQANCTLVLAHGAGAGMDSPFMQDFATGLGKLGLRVVRFEFPYMEKSRNDGKRRPPDREPVLRAAWLEVIERLEGRPLVISGKSMGGRIASLVADQANVKGLVCLGYPFHPVGKPDKLRTEHLKSIQTPTLILQGERDTFGNREQVPGYKLPAAIEVHWLADGDHSFKPRKSSGLREEDNWREAQQAMSEFISKTIS